MTIERLRETKRCKRKRKGGEFFSFLFEVVVFSSDDDDGKEKEKREKVNSPLFQGKKTQGKGALVFA